MIQSGASRLRVLWSGWRKSYVAGETIEKSDNEQMESDSVFNEIFSGEKKNESDSDKLLQIRLFQHMDSNPIGAEVYGFLVTHEFVISMILLIPQLSATPGHHMWIPATVWTQHYF